MIQCAKAKGNQQTNPPGYQGLASVLTHNDVLTLLIEPGCPPERIQRVYQLLTPAALHTLSEALLVLHLSPERLELRKSGDAAQAGALWADFLKPAFRRRYRQPHQELIVQASRIRTCPAPMVIDTTAGLGRDGFLLAAAGFQVHMMEHNPVVAALLQDGLARAAAHPETAAICQRIRLTTGNAIDGLAALTVCPEVIYLDPMFPGRMKAAKVKQELQILQMVAGQPEEAGQLLRMALSLRPKKVVVKRPLKGSFLMDLPPGYSLKGKAVRFDIYQPAAMGKTMDLVD